MYGLFSVISDHGTDRRRNALKKFLELNSDYTLFEMLPLEASSWGGWGSMIPYMQERIEYLTSVLPMLSGFKFLKHRQKVEKDIEIWKARIKEEEIDEIMKSFSWLSILPSIDKSDLATNAELNISLTSSLSLRSRPLGVQAVGLPVDDLE